MDLIPTIEVVKADGNGKNCEKVIKCEKRQGKKDVLLLSPAQITMAKRPFSSHKVGGELAPLIIDRIDRVLARTRNETPTNEQEDQNSSEAERNIETNVTLLLSGSRKFLCKIIDNTKRSRTLQKKQEDCLSPSRRERQLRE